MASSRREIANRRSAWGLLSLWFVSGPGLLLPALAFGQIPPPRELLPPPIGPLVADLLCGNGLIDPGEECDGNAGSCETSCLPRGSERSCQCDQPPSFPGIVFVAGTDTDELTLAWLPADDDTTAASELGYEVHASTTSGFDPDSTTLRSKVVGEVQGVASGLAADQEYFVLVVAIDENGNRSPERVEGRARTPAFSPVREPGVVLNEASELGLGEPRTISDNELRFDKTTGSSAPTVGSLLIGPVEGTGYLRRVTDVTETPDEYVVSTQDASLRDAYHTFPLHSEVTLVDVDSQAVAAARSKSSRLEVGYGPLPNGGRYSTLRWNEGLVVGRQEAVSDTLVSSQNESLGATYTFDVGGANFEVSLDFEPSVRGDFDWSLLDGVTRAEIIARGALSATVSARYSHSGSESLSFDQPLFTRTFKTAFLVGGAPVYQEVILTFSASGFVTATSEIDARKTAEASSFVEVGLRYNPGTGAWAPVQGTGLSRSVTTDLSIAGSVDGEVRLTPKISVRYYRIVSAGLSAEPFGTASLAAKLAPVHEPCTPPELTRFDVSVGMECNVDADVTVLNNTLAKAGPLEICGIAPLELFGLPDVTIDQVGGSGTSDDPIVLQALVTDGPNNPFQSDSAEWTRPPDTDGELEPDPADPYRAEYTCPTDPDASSTIVFSGHGVLGEPALQCKTIDIDCRCPPDGCVQIVFSGNTTKQFEFGILGSECTSDAATTVDEICPFPAGLGGAQTLVVRRVVGSATTCGTVTLKNGWEFTGVSNPGPPNPVQPDPGSTSVGGCWGTIGTLRTFKTFEIRRTN